MKNGDVVDALFAARRRELRRPTGTAAAADGPGPRRGGWAREELIGLRAAVALCGPDFSPDFATCFVPTRSPDEIRAFCNSAAFDE